MPFFPTGITTGGPYQPLNIYLTQISGLTPGFNSLMQFKSGSWASRTLTQVWTDFMADPGVASYAYTALPWTISTDKRLLGRDAALPPFSAQEISIGGGLTLGSSTLSADVTSVAGRTGAVTLAQADISGLMTGSSPTFAGLTLSSPLTAANGGTGLSSLGTGVTTALGVNVGSAGAFVTNGGALGTPSSGVVTNLTGTASININGTVGATTPSTGAFTSLVVDSSSFSSTGVTINGGQVAASRDGNPSLAINRYNSDGDVAEFFRTNSYVGSISVTTTATAYNTSSDRRLKTNIRDFTGSAEIIDAIKSRVYDWKTGEKDTVGFVAQELYDVYPAAVTKGDDGEEIAQQWAVDYSKIVPVLVAEVQALRARVATLERK